MTKKSTKTEVSSEYFKKSVIIGIATTPTEKEEVYRLRYRTYVEEMSYPLTYADHKNKLLYDELDEWGILLYAKVDSEIVGTMMVNIGCIPEFPDSLAQGLYLDRFKKFYSGTDNFMVAYISRGIIAPAYRNTPVFNLLSEKSYEIYCEHRVQFSFGICNFYLLPLHEHFGYRRFGRISVDQSYGTIANIVLLPDDIEHLRAVGSLFYNIAQKRDTLNINATTWFSKEFSETASIINSQLITEDQLWDIMRKRLGEPPNKVIHILYGLSEKEAKKVIHRCGVIIQCHENDYIVTCESVSHEMNILLSGRLNSLGQYSDKILPGQQFGANGLVDRGRHASNVIATTDAEILILSRHFFLKFSRHYPETANKILRNLIKYNT